MTSPSPILKFADVTIESKPHYETGLCDISFEVTPGDLFLVHIDREDERLPLADAAEGLEPPVQGCVTFLGLDWQSMSADRAATRRGKIGRMFEDEGWISDLDMEENIILSQCHHTRRDEAEILEEALQFSRLFGLPGLPRGRPGSVLRSDLRKAACIRALLGRPVLIILERPERGLYADLIAPLAEAVESARQRGAAVLWTASDPRIWNNPQLRATRRAKVAGSQLQTMELEA
jgi:phospholipid/cholesterol/gamma-HCH transport system ATP-binding protein